MTCLNCSNLTDSAISTIVFPALALAMSTIGILANFFLIIIIISDRRCRTPCFVLILGSSVGSLLMACGYSLASLSRLGAWPYGDQKRIVCQFLSGFILKTVSIPYNSQATFLISIDRLLGAVSPVLYRRRGRGYVAAGLSLCAVYGMVELFVLLISRPPNEMVESCADNAVVSGRIFMQVFSISNLFFCALCVAGYLAMLLYLQVQKAKVHSLACKGGFETMTEKLLYLKQYKAVMPAAKLLLILYMLLGIAPEVFYCIASRVPEWSKPLSNAGEQLKIASALVEIISLSVRSQQFRESVARLFGRGGQQ